MLNSLYHTANRSTTAGRLSPGWLLLLLCSLLASPPILADSLLSTLWFKQQRERFEAGLVRGLCQEVSTRLASVSRNDCIDLDLSLTSGRSVLNRPILMREFPPLDGRAPLGRVLVVGGMHGDEYASISVVFKWMKTLSEHHSGMFHWRVVPLLNPDGLLSEQSTRTNANGVDINRNFPTPDWIENWEREWARKRRNPRRYPGTGPASEPETRWLTGEIDEFKPNAIIAVHTPYGVVDADGPLGGPKRLGKLRLRLLGNFTGSLGRYAGVHKGIPVVTIELSSTDDMPAQEEMSAIWVDLVAWLSDVLPSAPMRADATEHPEG
jgi:protein MpaA